MTDVSLATAAALAQVDRRVARRSGELAAGIVSSSGRLRLIGAAASAKRLPVAPVRMTRGPARKASALVDYPVGIRAIGPGMPRAAAMAGFVRALRADFVFASRGQVRLQQARSGSGAVGPRAAWRRGALPPKGLTALPSAGRGLASHAPLATIEWLGGIALRGGIQGPRAPAMQQVAPVSPRWRPWGQRAGADPSRAARPIAATLATFRGRAVVPTPRKPTAPVDRLAQADVARPPLAALNWQRSPGRHDTPELAREVVDHLARMATRPPSGMSGVDERATPIFAGMVGPA